MIKLSVSCGKIPPSNRRNRAVNFMNMFLFFLQKRSNLNFTLLYQVLSKSSKKSILPYIILFSWFFSTKTKGVPLDFFQNPSYLIPVGITIKILKKLFFYKIYKIFFESNIILISFLFLLSQKIIKNKSN